MTSDAIAWISALSGSALTLVMVLVLDLSKIASLDTAVALLLFSLVTAAHFRVRHETGGRLWLLVVALASTLVTLVVFCTTTLVHEPATAAALVAIIALSIGVDLTWKRVRDHQRQEPTPVAG